MSAAEELANELLMAKKIQVWSAIALDSTQLCLTTFMIIYHRVKARHKLFTWKIRIQIALLWLLPLMFNTCNIWAVSNDEYVMRRSVTPVWVFTEFTTASVIFWLQHWLYVSMYMQIALLIPLTFCV